MNEFFPHTEATTDRPDFGPYDRQFTPPEITVEVLGERRGTGSSIPVVGYTAVQLPPHGPVEGFATTATFNFKKNEWDPENVRYWHPKLNSDGFPMMDAER